MNSLKEAMHLISNILDIDQSLDGELYLKEFIKNIANNLNVKYVLIGHPSKEDLSEIQTDVVWIENDFVDNFVYELKGTPCEIVLTGQRVCIHDSNVCIDFPDDLLLQEMKVQSYVGAPVTSKRKAGVSSILVLLDDKPMENKEFFTVVTEFLALRASSEIEKIYSEKYLKEQIEERTKALNEANLKIKDLELKRTEERLEKLFNNSQSGLLYIDENRTLLKANKRFAQILGYDSPVDLIGFSMEAFHLNHQRYIEFGKNNFETLIERLENFNIEYELKRKDGTSVWCELSGRALDNNIPADLAEGVLWTVNDISLRKKYEEELKEKQVLLKNILATIPDMVWLKDNNGVYLTCNPEFESFFGAKEEDIVGKTDYDFVDKELADFFRKHDNNAMNSEKVLLNEEWVTYANSNKKVLLDTSKKAMKNSDGKVIGVLGIGHDVTERKKKEDELIELNKLAVELSESQQILLSLFDKGESVLFRWRNDITWSIDYVSNSVEELLGYDKEDFLSNRVNFAECIHPDDLKRVKKEVEVSLEKKLDYFKHEPYRILTSSNSERWVMDHTATLKDENGDITHFIGYITDITEQIRSQEIMFHQAKIASLGEMLGNIAHQWRQPLSIISTTATGSKIKKELGLLDDEEFTRNMNSINEKVQYLSKTIDDFRNFFLSDSGQKSKVNIVDTVEKVISLVGDALKSSNVEIVREYEFEEAFVIYNENLLIQALINIFNNARDALNLVNCTDCEKYVFVELSQKDKNICITIKDNAGGIPSNIMNKIFDPYFTTKHKSQGTGIGLYMTNQIISKHLNSKMYVENTKYDYLDKTHKGASFKIVIRLEEDEIY